MLSLPKKDDLRPAKLLRLFRELKFMPHAFDCECGLDLEPWEIVDPIENALADVAAILDPKEYKQEKIQRSLIGSGRIFDPLFMDGTIRVINYL